MSAAEQPRRCPNCGALVVDRRSPVCTTCRHELPAEWIMTPGQSARLKQLDRQMQASHRAEMNALDPRNAPGTPPIVRLLETPWGM